MQSRLTLFLIAIICLITSRAGAASICSIQTTTTGWTWNCPQVPTGSVCKDVSEDGIDYSSGHSVSSTTLTAKYGSIAAAYVAINTRMINEGITTAGQYSYTFASNYPTNGVLYEPTEDMGLYLQQDRFQWHMKNQAYVVAPSSMTCNSAGSFFQGETPDDFDPAATANYTSIWSIPSNGNPSSIYTSYPSTQVRDFIPDDGDSLYVYDSIPTHPDFAYILAANSPVQVVGSTTYAGGAFNYTNTTAYVKIGLVDYLAGKYGCVGSEASITGLSENGYVATATVSNSFTAGEMVIISGATPSGYNNNGYPVLVMPQNLSSSSFQYVLATAGLGGGSGASVSAVESPLVTTGTDPIGLPTCGSSLITSSLSTLNTAWGTSFTTWGTSDTNGLAGIAAGGGTAVCATATTGNTWQSNHSYTGPAMIYDGTNYEYTGLSCTSTNGTHPTWNTTLLGATQDNSCVWFNTGATNLWPYASPQCTGNGAGTNIAYASWGTGTGLLDEAGNHILSSSFKSGCGTNPPNYASQTWGKTTTVQTDLRQFVGLDGAMHALLHRVGYAAECGGTCPPLADLYYDSPNEVYQQAFPMLDLGVISPFYYTSLASLEARTQAMVNNDGGIPVRVHNYVGVPATSGCSTSQSILCTTTESGEGSIEEQYDSGILRDKNPLGKYPILGYGHWMGYDWNNSSSSGIYSIKDNMYDGSNASTLTTCTSTWIASTTYTLPKCILDSNNKKEFLAITGEAGANCTSGSGSHPTWATTYGALTYGDGNCIWDNGLTYAQNAEASNFGNYLTPLIQFWTGQNGSICDPTTSMTGGSNGIKAGGIAF